MDPDETLNELRVIVARVQAEQRITQQDVERGAELFAALDGFLSSGGFMPVAWRYGRRPLFSSIATHGGYAPGGSAAEHGAE